MTCRFHTTSPALLPCDAGLSDGFCMISRMTLSRTLLVVVTFLVLLWYFAVPGNGWAAPSRPAPQWVYTAGMAASAPPAGTTAKRAWIVCRVFGQYPRRCRAALNVFWCESGLRPWARNGQYLGIPQMGEHERRTYGWGRTAWLQLHGARRLFRHRGWQPWSCRP